MDISKFAKKPELIKMEINDEDIVSQYGDSISFYIYDNVDISTYFDFYKVQQQQDGVKLQELMRKIILKDDGTPALAADEMLPMDLTLAALVKINENLGKSNTKSLTQATGNQ